MLLHTMSTDMPKGTAEWLNMRTWCSAHHHIRCDEELLPEPRVPSERDIVDYLMGESQLPMVSGGVNFPASTC